MALKFILFLVAAVGAASLQDYQQPQSQQHQQQQQQQQQHTTEPENRQQSNDNRFVVDTQHANEEQIGYDFSYSVHDPVTGDQKSQEESRRNGHVRGQYSWVDADGIRQIVDYRADDRTGFNAQQRSEPVNRPRLNRVLKLVPAQSVKPLYTIDTVLAPAYTSVTRVDQIRRRDQDTTRGGGREGQQSEKLGDARANRRDELSEQRDERREGRPEATEHEDRHEERHDERREEHRDDRRQDQQREDRRDEDRRERERHDERRVEHRDERRNEQRQENQDDRRQQGLGAGIQSEVRFHAPSVTYEYRN
ncbi:zinc finger CCCH domain-containing protein 13-like isoform X1 [Anopheles bellator]|uniref:zinc finger CCCH domain-containing protein 13-like isoform X1 n=1 Tax=Anopheles bellator TaxID=139047 RepID=UPI002648C6BB|nr:zinc finger CCCH domain-containing protein 13-like isoform X1 [Anopheles bellator]